MTGPKPGLLGLLPQGPLGDVETRIRNQLEQEGPLPLQLKYDIVPVVLVGDATTPGMAQQRGRAWQAPFEAFATGTNLALAPATTNGMVIDAVQVAVSGGTANADLIRFYENAPTVAAPIIPATADVPFVDRFLGDFAPVLRGTGAGAPTGTVIFTSPIPASGLWIPCRVFIPFGTIWTARWVASVAGLCSVNVFGRTF